MLPLVRCGVREVVVVSDRSLQEIENVRFACPPRWLTNLSGRALAKLAWLIITAIRPRPDLFIGYHIFPGAVTALIAARLFGRPACYQMTGGPVEVVGGGWRAENPLMARLTRPSAVVEHLAIAMIRQFDLVVVRGSKAQEFLARHGIHESVAVITGSITACSNVPPAERQYDLVFVGRLTEIKRPVMFVEIAARVKRQFPSLRVAVVGTGPLLSALQQRSRELNIDDSIEFCGQRLDVADIVARARVFVLTSRSEGFSIAMVEAMGAGAVPVVADVGELGDLIVSGESGYLVSPDELEAYVEPIVHVLRDSDLFERLSTCAAKIAMSRAAAEVIAAHWANHLVALSRRSGNPCGAASRGEPRQAALDPTTGSRDRDSSLRP